MSATYNLASLYHSHHSRYLEDLPFWAEMAGQLGDPILELGCGTGRVLTSLQETGHQIFGMDHNYGMLSFLRNHHSHEATSTFHLFQGDLTQFHLARRFNLIYLPCNTYSTLSITERQAALNCIKKHLLPSGAFVLSVPNPELFHDLPRDSEPEVEETFVYPKTGEMVQVSSAWTQSAGEIIFSWYYDIISDNGQVKRVTLATRHLLTPAHDYLAEIESAGLQVAMKWGNFDGSPYSSDAPYFIVKTTL